VALARNGNKDQALDFIKRTMTLDGIMNGPNGQPAMYEVRNADKNNPAVYGTVDKLSLCGSEDGIFTHFIIFI